MASRENEKMVNGFEPDADLSVFHWAVAGIDFFLLIFHFFFYGILVYVFENSNHIMWISNYSVKKDLINAPAITSV